MSRVGLNDDPKTPVRELSVAKKQLVEIAKAISNDVKLLVLDENGQQLLLIKKQSCYLRLFEN